MYKVRKLGTIFKKLDESKHFYDDTKIISSITSKNHKDHLKLILSRVFDFNFEGVDVDEIEKMKLKLCLLNKYKIITNFLNSRYDKPKVRANFINTIMTIMRLFDLHVDKKKPKIEFYDKGLKKDVMTHPFIPSYQKYLDYVSCIYKKIKDEKSEQIEKGGKNTMKNFITDSEIDSLIDNHLKKFNNTKKLKHLQDTIIIMLFTKQNPLRLDFNDMIMSYDYEKDLKKYGDKYNYVDLTNGFFYILNYKTSSIKSGIIKEAISEELKKHIIVLFENRNYKDNLPIMLLDNNNEPMTAHYLGIKLKRLTGCSANDYRHRAMTGDDVDEFVKEYRKMEMKAKQMGTSIKMLINNYHS
jgi:hypothetical protein